MSVYGTVYGGTGGGLTSDQAAQLSEIIAMLQQDAPISANGQQFNSRKIVRGDAYGGGGRNFFVTRSSNAEWPLDLSQYTWSFVAAKDPANANVGGTLAGTATVAIASGDDRYISVTLTTNDATVAEGRHGYQVVGTKSGAKWSIELGTADVVASPT